MAVDIDGDVTLLGEDPVGLRPQVEEDVEEVYGFQVGGDGYSEVRLSEYLLDLLPLCLQGSAFQVGDTKAVVAVQPQVEVGLGELVQHVQSDQLTD